MDPDNIVLDNKNAMNSEKKARKEEECPIDDERDAHIKSDPGSSQFSSIAPPKNLQIKLQISLPNLPSPTMSSPRSRISQSFKLSNSQVLASNLYTNGSSSSSKRNQIKDMPQIVSIYDSLPAQLKSYFLLHLLKRSPMSTLQLVLSLVIPTLRRDFLELLPDEVCFKILSYLDIASIGRCMSVSRTWYNLISSSSAELLLWVPRLLSEGWLADPNEEGRQEFTYENDAKTKNYYMNLFKKHYIVKKNWHFGRYKQISFPEHSFNVVTCLQFDSKRIVSGSDDQTIHIYDINTGALIRKLEGHDGGVWALQYWNDMLVSGSTDRTVRVWDMNTGECTHLFEGHTSTVRCLIIVIPSYCHIAKKMLPERPLIVTGSRDSTLRVWLLPQQNGNEATGSQNQENNGRNSSSNVNCSSPRVDGRSQSSENESQDHNVDTENASGTYNNVGRMSDTSNPYFLNILLGHTNSVRAIAGKCNVLISGSYDCTVRAWDLSSGKCDYVFRGHREKVYSVGYCHSLQRAASGSMDSTVRVWCTRTGACIFSLEGHTSLVGLLEISDAFLVSAAADSTLRIWSTETGECLANLTGHSAAITCFHHDPKLNRIVSGSEKGVKVWELCSTGNPFDNKHSKKNSGTSEDFGSSNKNKPVYGRFIMDLVARVQGVWRVKMSERHLVTAVQKEEGKTWFEVLDFGCDDISNSA